jgi:hypothetical protein
MVVLGGEGISHCLDAIIWKQKTVSCIDIAGIPHCLTEQTAPLADSTFQIEYVHSVLVVLLCFLPCCFSNLMSPP